MRTELWERRYTHGGRVAHLLPYGFDERRYPYTAGACGRAPRWGAVWLGTGDQAEYERAAALPTCPQCTARTTTANPQPV